ncbi:MAG TPA: hypothetical protein PLY88_01540 [Candidatus Omnitrophota bacterium]|nr:hypothetical protein [Candidatus Omnitrophota bacterium]
MEIEIKAHSDTGKFSVGEAFWKNKATLSDLKPRFRTLIEAVGHPGDLFLTQWAQLAAITLDFKPDLIIELGRGRGNSTCAFTETARQFPGKKTTVASFCLSEDWEKLTQPRLKPIVDNGWFDNLKIYNENILLFPFEELIAKSERCLIFWDAHGFEIAECVLGKILPLVVRKPHLVLMHDLSDTRYTDPKGRYYGEKSLWKGNNWEGPRLRIGHIDSAVEQAVAILDFTARNNFELESADHDLHTYFIEQYPDRLKELQAELGSDFFSLSAHWFHFTLNGITGTLTFPKIHTGKQGQDAPQSAAPAAPFGVFHLLKRITKKILKIFR